MVKAHPLFPYFLEKHLAIPTSPFLNLLINSFCVTIHYISRGCLDDEKIVELSKS